MAEDTRPRFIYHGSSSSGETRKRFEYHPLSLDVVRVGDTLPVEFQRVIEDLDPALPVEWRRKAELLGQFLISAAKGKSLIDRSGNSLETVSEVEGQ